VHRLTLRRSAVAAERRSGSPAPADLEPDRVIEMHHKQPSRPWQCGSCFTPGATVRVVPAWLLLLCLLFRSSWLTVGTGPRSAPPECCIAGADGAAVTVPAGVAGGVSDHERQPSAPVRAGERQSGRLLQDRLGPPGARSLSGRYWTLGVRLRARLWDSGRPLVWLRVLRR
jgi:hypothetical protein